MSLHTLNLSHTFLSSGVSSMTCFPFEVNMYFHALNLSQTLLDAVILCFCFQSSLMNIHLCLHMILFALIFRFFLAFEFNELSNCALKWNQRVINLSSPTILSD
uniref:Uncharacterized protein n=1 Tax=Populus davidiana TaxID=266767 RepID=A0A6M2E700_9ROSI